MQFLSISRESISKHFATGDILSYKMIAHMVTVVTKIYWTKTIEFSVERNPTHDVGCPKIAHT